jgi:hypothetical protein
MEYSEECKRGSEEYAWTRVRILHTVDSVPSLRNWAILGIAARVLSSLRSAREDLRVRVD